MPRKGSVLERTFLMSLLHTTHHVATLSRKLFIPTCAQIRHIIVVRCESVTIPLRSKFWTVYTLPTVLGAALPSVTSSIACVSFHFHSISLSLSFPFFLAADRRLYFHWISALASSGIRWMYRIRQKLQLIS